MKTKREEDHPNRRRPTPVRKWRFLGLLLVMALVLAACADDDADPVDPDDTAPVTDDTPAPTPDDDDEVTVRVGMAPAPTVGVEPVLINDEGGLSLFGQTAEYLVFSDAELNLVPVLAESWESNDALDEWTFTLREGITFHDGSPLTAEDVVATFNGPIGEGNAASAFETYGVEPFAAAEVVDERTVQFNLSRPNGAFPFFVSSDNYNAAILPASFWDAYDTGTYEGSFIGTGPWLNESYDPGTRAVYVKNEDYWGDNSGQPDRMEVFMYDDEAAMITAFQGGNLDVLYRVSFTNAQALEAGGAEVASIPTAQHRQLYMDTSQPPFDDPRVRQALALTLDREELVEGLLGGFGSVGNDHPIWDVFPMYDDGAVPQRTQDLEEAQALLEAAGYPDGFSARLDVLDFAEVALLAQTVEAWAAQIGIDLDVNVFDADTYYADYWLAADQSAGIVNYGHRGVPHVYLGAPLLSTGTWNASHWNNPEYDALFAEFSGAPDTDTERELAGQIQSLLWEEVPFIVPYYIHFISVTVPNFEGLVTTGMGHFSIVDGRFTN